MSRNALRFGSRVIALAWACWWVFFVVASAIVEREPLGAAILQGLVAAVVFLGSIAVSYRWERFGASLLVAEGLLVAVGYPLMAAHRFPAGSIAFVVATLGGPPLASGIALILARKFAEPRRPVPAG